MHNHIPFQEVALLWEDYKKQYVKRSTLSIYSIHLRTHLIPAFGTRTSISESDVQSFVNTRLADGLNPKTVKDILMILKMILRYAARYHGWEYPPMDIHFPPARVKPGLQVLSLVQQRRLMQYLSHHPNLYNMGIALSLGTGLRIGEICALTWEDVDLRACVLRVTKTLQRIYVGRRQTELLIDTPKTANSYREIPLSASLIAMLRSLKGASQSGDYVLTGGPQPIEPGPYRAYFQKLMRSLDFPPICFHGLRHSFATRCIESNCDYKTVSALLGHANINTTLNLYVHPGFEQKKKCVNRAAKGLM